MSGGSVRHSDLVARMPAAMNADPTSTTTAAGETACSPGRRMMIAPAKPTAVAVQRRRRTVSPRKSAAPAVTNSGAVKVSAVTSAIWISETPINVQAVAAT